MNGCDGTLAVVRDALTCTIQVSTLRAAPFSLEWGTSVFAKIIAFNNYGDSLQSEAGNGAVIITYPDSPLQLEEVVELRTPSTITFKWLEGFANGGTPVIDYRVNYDEAQGVYVVLQEFYTELQITATNLQYGLVYFFKVEARNEFGYSEPSEIISILCAAAPETPGLPSTEVQFD